MAATDDSYKWDFVRLLLQSAFSAREMLNPQCQLELAPVPQMFASADEYVRVMQPLVVEEALAGIKAELETAAAAVLSREKGKGGGGGIPGPRGVRVQLSGASHDVGGGLVALSASSTVAGPAAGKPKSSNGTPFPNDLIVISRHIDGFVSNCGNSRSEAPQPYAFGFVSSCVPDFDIAELAFIGKVLQSIKGDLPVSEGYWYVWSAGNIITSLREYAAMRRVTEYSGPLLDALLTCRTPDAAAAAAASTSQTVSSGAAASGAKPVDRADRVVYASEAYKHHLTASFNPSQKAAISAALKSEGVLCHDCRGMVKLHACVMLSPWCAGFTLIQGPPGTGKTSTVVGILNTLHLYALNKFRAQLAYNDETMKCPGLERTSRCCVAFAMAV